MIAVETLSVSSRWRSTALHAAAGHRHLELGDVGVRGRPRHLDMYLGLLREFVRQLLIGGGMVAENSRVWRLAGSFEQIVSISGMNPMSSIRSASSITKKVAPGQQDLAALEQVHQPARVAISTSTPSDSA